MVVYFYWISNPDISLATMEGKEHIRNLGIILQNISKTNEKMTKTRAQMKEDFCRLAELLRVAESSEARQEPEPEPEVVPESRVQSPQSPVSRVQRFIRSW